MARIDALFEQMLAMDASDLHLHEGAPPKCRIHGEIIPMENFPVLLNLDLRRMLREICSADRWEHFESTGDADFAYAFPGGARFRANFKKHIKGIGAVFRTIPSRIASLEELGAPPALKSFGNVNSGLCLVTGPTGSGKSTTLAAIVDHINSTEKRVIITIEEPVEFVHPQKLSAVSQREVGVDVHSFSDGLLSGIRQDADVILVGEMRDLDTISLAVRAAEMGYLVFGTLHTNSAAKTVDRIIDVFPSDQQGAIRQSLAVALRAVCAQLLLKRKDGQGRIAVHEVLVQTRAISNLIREAKTGQINQTIMSNRALGMQLMDDSIEGALKKGLITPEEAYAHALEKERFAPFLRNQ
jgi:twitching motility protein PilT